MALRTVLGPRTQPQASTRARGDHTLLGPTGCRGHVFVGCRQTTGLKSRIFLLLALVLVFKGLIPKSHISTHPGSELWDRVSALCMREILSFL